MSIFLGSRIRASSLVTRKWGRGVVGVKFYSTKNDGSLITKALLDHLTVKVPRNIDNGLQRLYDESNTEPIKFENEQELRGVRDPGVQFLFNFNAMRLAPLFHSCPQFTARFFPRTHFICDFRKSSLGFVVQYGPGTEGNVLAEGKAKKSGSVQENSSHASRNPMKYSVGRKLLKNALRHALFNSTKKYMSNNVTGDRLQGVFYFRADHVFVTEEEIKALQTEMDKLTRRVYRDLIRRNLEVSRWVAMSNQRLNLSVANRLLVESYGFDPKSKLKVRRW